MTLVLAWGLYRGCRFAARCWAINLFTAGVAIAYYLIVPLSFAPDGMTSLLQHGAITACVANALPPLFFAVALTAALKHFPIRVGWRRLIGGVGAIVLVLLACAAVYLMYGIAQPEEFAACHGLVAVGRTAGARFLPIGFLSHMKLSFVPRTPMASIVHQGVGLGVLDRGAGRVIQRMSDVSESNERAQARAERLVETGGESMSFMTTWKRNSYWLSPTGKSAVAYRVLNVGIALTCTGPFGEPSEWMDDLTGFTQYCVERSLSPVFYSVHEQRDALLEAGWSSIEVGSEMVVDPRGWKTTAQEMAGCAHRHQQGQARRRDRCAVHVPGKRRSMCASRSRTSPRVARAQGAAGNEVHARRCRGTARPARAAALRHRRGRARAGVTSWLPTWRDGRIVGWTLDFMRHRTDSPNGMEFLDRAHGRAPARRGACGS